MYVLTGLFDELTGLLPEGSFPHAVFGPSLRYFKGLIGSMEAKHALREAGVAPGGRSSAIGEAWSGGGSMYPPERPAGARKVVAAPLRQGEGANRHFSRQHGRRDHNWQWDMMKSPWSLGLMRKGRLALGVSEEEADEFEEAGIIAFPGHVVKHKDSVKNGGYGKTIGTLVLRSPESAFVCVQVRGKRRESTQVQRCCSRSVWWSSLSLPPSPLPTHTPVRCRWRFPDSLNFFVRAEKKTRVCVTKYAVVFFIQER